MKIKQIWTQCWTQDAQIVFVYSLSILLIPEMERSMHQI